MKITFLLIFILSWIACLSQPNSQHKQEKDYNFDNTLDYRIKSLSDTTKWEYYIFNPGTNTFDKDTLLSNLDWTLFDFEKKKFYGTKSTRISALITQTDFYENSNGEPTLIKREICRQKFQNSERSDCDIYITVNGELIYKETRMGAE